MNELIEDSQNTDHRKNKTIWLWWTESNEMSDDRRRCLDQFAGKNASCNVKLITPDIIAHLPNMHKGYRFLSAMQKGNYLKCYFMHNFGGGYSDIKQTTCDWGPYFSELEKSDKIGIGYREKPRESARLENCTLDPTKSVYCREFTLDETGTRWSSRHLKSNENKLIGNGCYIFRKQTEFTQDWWNALHEKMDGYYDELKKNPATWPRDTASVPGYPPQLDPNTGIPSKYPIAHTVNGGCVFHPLVLKYSEQILKTLPIFVKSAYK